MNRKLLPILAASALVAVPLTMAACGGGSSPAAQATTTSAPATSTPTTSTPAAVQTPPGAVVKVNLGKTGEFTIDPSTTSVPAGPVTFQVAQHGKVVHEMVVIRTDVKAAKIPIVAGKADETGNIGETGDMAVGSTKDLSVDLKAGHYALICNLPGHYAGGMHTDFTVV